LLGGGSAQRLQIDVNLTVVHAGRVVTLLGSADLLRHHAFGFFTSSADTKLPRRIDSGRAVPGKVTICTMKCPSRSGGRNSPLVPGAASTEDGAAIIGWGDHSANVALGG